MMTNHHPARTTWLGGVRLFAVLGLVQGCSLYPKLDVQELTAETEIVQVQDVPFFPQEEFQCGPAALAAVLGAAGIATTPSELTPEVYLPGRQGSLQLELISATRRAGLLPYVLDGEPAALIREIESGQPVMVFQNLRTRHFPVWHFSVLLGFDARDNEFIFNSGLNSGVTIDARTFLRTWNWAGRWAMVALRPGTLPAAADPQRYMEAVAVFESVAGSDKAMPAWEAAAVHWPSDPRPQLALGNTAYSAGDLPGAARHYRTGLALDPANPALNNNLATVLGEIGCPRAGEKLLRPIIPSLAEGSNWQDPAQQTLLELARKPGPDAAGCPFF